MAVTNSSTFEIKISANTEQAKAALKEFAKVTGESKSSSEGGAKGFESLAGKMVGVSAAIEIAKSAYEAVAAVVEHVTEVFEHHEKASRALNIAMEYSGHYSQASRKELGEYAEEMQHLTGVAESTTIGLMAQAKQIGLTDEQTKEAILAAANLAAVKGMDMSQAFSAVTGTLHGASEELKAMVPGLRHVGNESLATGGAFKIIAEQFKGAAAEGGKTWEAYKARSQSAKDQIIAGIGEVISKGVGFTEIAKGQAEFWEKAAKFILSFKEDAIAALQAVRTGLASIDWTEIGNQMTAIGIILAGLIGPTLLTALGSAAAAVGAFAAAWIAIPAAIGGTLLAIDLVVKNFDKLPVLGTLLGDVIARSFLNIKNIFGQVLAFITSGISDLLSSIPGGEKMFGGAIAGLNKFTDKIDVEVDDTAEKFDKLGVEISKSWGKLDQGALGAGINLISKLGDTVTSTFNKIKDVGDKSDELSNKGGKVNVEDPLLKEKYDLASRHLRSFLMSGEATRIEIDKIGESGATALIKQTDTELKNAKDALDLAISYRGKNQAEIDKYNEAYLAKTELVAKKLEQMAMTETEVNSKALDDQLSDLEGHLKAGRMMQEDYADAVAEAQHKHTMAQAATDQKPVSNQAEEMSVGVISPLMGGIDKMVDAIKGLIDFLPSFINKVADIFTGLRDLPLKFAAAIQNVTSAVLSMFTNLATNLTSMVDKVMASLNNFFDKLPDAIAGFMEHLPDFIQHILDKLPGLLMKAFISFTIMLPISLTVGLIKAIPAALKAIITAVFGSKEMFNGIANALKQAMAMLSGMFKDLLKGNFKFPSLKVDAKPITQAFDAIKGSSSDIFKIADFANATKSVNVGDSIRDAVNSSAMNIGKLLAALWKSFEDIVHRVWMWVWDKIIAPIEGLLMKAWRWVWDTVLAPIFDVVKKAWSWVYDNIIAPIVDVVKVAFGFVSSILEVEWAAFKAIGKIVGDLLDVEWEAFKAIGKTVVNFLSAEWDAMKAAFSLVIDLFKDSFAAFKLIGRGIYDLFTGNWADLKAVGKGISDLFTKVIDQFSSTFKSITKAFSGVLDPITNFKFPSFSWPAIKVPDLSIQKPSWWKLEGGGPVAGVVSNITTSIGKTATSVAHKLGFAEGGVVRNGTLYAEDGTGVFGTDIVPAMLTPGEFVVNRHAANRVGLPALERINDGVSPNGGGMSVSAPITINTTQPVDDTFIRNKLVPTLMEAIRKASLNGRFVMAQSGIRKV